MNKILSFIADGFLNIGDAYVSHREYVRPDKNGFEKDQAKLRGDVVVVGQGMEKVIARHGKQPHKLTGR